MQVPEQPVLHPPEQVVLQLVLQPPVQELLQLEQVDDLEVPSQVPEQVVLQPPVQELLQLEQVDDLVVPSQVAEQAVLQAPEQLDEQDDPVQELPPLALSKSFINKSSSLSQERSEGIMETPAMMGRVLLTACLKKSLRLIMSLFICRYFNVKILYDKLSERQQFLSFRFESQTSMNPCP